MLDGVVGKGEMGQRGKFKQTAQIAVRGDGIICERLE